MAKIRSLQPFEIKQLQPHHLALRWVDAQSKIDKHRLLMPAFLELPRPCQLGTVPPGIPIEADVVGRERVRLEHDVELLRVTEIARLFPATRRLSFGWSKRLTGYRAVFRPRPEAQPSGSDLP